jgi:hypothetical protein
MSVIEQEPQAPRTKGVDGLAIASLVLGILWIWWIGSILALIFGIIAIKRINRSNGWRTGKGMAIAGTVLGAVGAVTLAAAIVLVAVGAANSDSSSFDSSSFYYNNTTVAAYNQPVVTEAPTTTIPPPSVERAHEVAFNFRKLFSNPDWKTYCQNYIWGASPFFERLRREWPQVADFGDDDEAQIQLDINVAIDDMRTNWCPEVGP